MSRFHTESADARMCRAREEKPAARGPVPALLAAFYLCWLAQSLLVQHLFDYVHVPAILLAILFLILVTTNAPRITAGRRIA